MSENQTDQPTIQELRDAADRGRQAEAEKQALQRELAFAKAGIDTDTPLGAMFVKGYDGDLDVAKVKEAWATVAPTAPATEEAPATPVVTEEQRTETEQRRTLTSGGAGDTPLEQPKPDPVQRGYKEFQERLQNGESREKASQSVFGSLISAAAEGDERAIWTGWTEEQLGHR